MESGRKPGEIGRMEREIGRMERDLNELYCELGKSVLELVEREGSRANRLVDRIVEARSRLAGLKSAAKTNGVAQIK